MEKTKKCPHCKSEVNEKATRCPHCHGKILYMSKAAKIAAGIFGFIIILFIFTGNDNDPVTQPVTFSDTPGIGAEAYLRLPDITDPEQVICLGETEEDFDKVGKALLAKDYVGLLEIPGAFCVSNGTKVLVIDSSFGVRRVRIMQGVREVDNDKLLMTGWTAMEWVVSN